MSDTQDEKPESPEIYIMGLTVKGSNEDHSYEFCSAHEQMLLSLRNFIHDLHQSDVYLPRKVFYNLLDDMECFVFEPDKHDKEKIRFETIEKDQDVPPPSIAIAVKNLTHDMAGVGLELQPKTSRSLKKLFRQNLSKAFDTSAIDQVPEETAKLLERQQAKRRIAKASSQDKASLQIGKHITGKEAHRLLKRAMMHYWDNIGSALKAGLYEGASNAPTFYMAAEAPNPNIIQSAIGGGGLVVSFAGEAGLNFMRFMKLLSMEDKYQQLSETAGEEEALKTLENKMHGQGLLFENLSEQDLRAYPEDLFNNIIETRRIFTKQGHFKQRVEDVSDYLKSNKVEAAKKIALSPIKLLDATRKLALNTVDLTFNLGKDSIKNPFKPEFWHHIGVGAVRIVQAPFTYKIFNNEVRHRNKQRPHFHELSLGKDKTSLIAKSDEEFTHELRQTRQSIRKNIAGSKFEIGRYGMETMFISGHAVEAAHLFDPESLMQGEMSPDNIKFAVSALSISLALEPWAHLGHNLDSLHKKITGKRSKQAYQYDRYLQLEDTVARKQAVETDSEIEEEEEEDNSPNQPSP